MTNQTIYGQICFWDVYTVQVFFSVSKKEHYFIHQIIRVHTNG